MVVPDYNLGIMVVTDYNLGIMVVPDYNLGVMVVPDYNLGISNPLKEGPSFLLCLWVFPYPHHPLFYTYI